MNKQKVCFIICTNNEVYEKEVLKYIDNLIKPDGYEVEILIIHDAVCMASGYNEGMRASDAKYKIYLHQDTFILNPNFITDILRIFEDRTIGMIGMVGSKAMPENAIMWKGERIGRLYSSMTYRTGESIIGDVDGLCEDVEAIDGVLMATQYDLPWRDDLFKGWDFYDVSQSQEFIKNGYRVVVAAQKETWCMHDDGFLNLKNYYKARKIYLTHYGKS